MLSRIAQCLFFVMVVSLNRPGSDTDGPGRAGTAAPDEHHH